MKVLSVVGARPQFVKLAPVADAMSAAGVRHVVVHTGQHYDARMSHDFFESLTIPSPKYNLGIGSGSHGVQTGSMLMAIDPVLANEKPDWVLVYGDTNSTLAAAIAATKLHLPLAHLEAGLRSFNRRMPEEHNRVLTDHSADVCLAPSRVAMENLRQEGLSDRSRLVGDVMVDVLLKVAGAVRDRPVDSPIPTDRQTFTLSTIHRPYNTDDPRRLSDIIDALGALPHTVYLAVHPRLRSKAAEFGISLETGVIRPVEPLSYPQLVQALMGAASVVTDSGGLQKEAFALHVPTTTIRTETEWTETLTDGWNMLVPDPADLVAAVGRVTPPTASQNVYGDGQAAQSVVCELLSGQAQLQP